MFTYKKINKQINFSYSYYLLPSLYLAPIHFRRLTGCVYESIKGFTLHGDERLLAIPASCYQVSDNNQNLNYF